jgi:transposase
MNNLSSSMNSVEWRRNKVQELASQGYNQSEISRILQISQPTIYRDVTYLRQRAKEAQLSQEAEVFSIIHLQNCFHIPL